MNINVYKRVDVKYLFIHGGECNGNILGSYLIYDINGKEFLSVEHDNKELRPQLKAHAATFLYDKISRCFDIIITGGITKTHTFNCESVSESNNFYKDKCLCTGKSMNEEIYGFRNGAFYNINVKNRNDFKDRLKRMGHSMVNMGENDNRIMIVGGFIQYVGYVIDLIILHPINNLNSKYEFEAEMIRLDRIPGRMYATTQVVGNKIVLFGGLNDKKLLNDIWVINTKDWVSFNIPNDPNFIYPRIGMSSIFYKDTEKESRVIIYGGTYTSGKNIYAGVNNEIIVIHIKVSYIQ